MGLPFRALRFWCYCKGMYVGQYALGTPCKPITPTRVSYGWALRWALKNHPIAAAASSTLQQHELVLEVYDDVTPFPRENANCRCGRIVSGLLCLRNAAVANSWSCSSAHTVLTLTVFHRLSAQTQTTLFGDTPPRSAQQASRLRESPVFAASVRWRRTVTAAPGS